MNGKPYAKDVFLADGTWHDAVTHLICCFCAATHKIEYRYKDGKLQQMFTLDPATTAINRQEQFGEQAPLITELLNETRYKPQAHDTLPETKRAGE